MDNYKKLSDFSVKSIINDNDIIPVLSKSDNNEFTNNNIEAISLKQYSASNKNDIGLGNVDNTSDADKPVSIATKNAISSALQSMYPVGSIYTNASDGTNPSSLLGFGVWNKFASGRVMVGDGSSDKSFSAGSTGGESTHTLTIAEIPSHNHGVNSISNSYGAQIGSGSYAGDLLVQQWNGEADGTTKNTGGGEAHNNLQPYVVVYMWVRIS